MKVLISSQVELRYGKDWNGINPIQSNPIQSNPIQSNPIQSNYYACGLCSKERGFFALRITRSFFSKQNRAGHGNAQRGVQRWQQKDESSSAKAKGRVLLPSVYIVLKGGERIKT
jgi:hypothetical protein